MLENGTWDALSANSLSVILTGIVVVFAILVILIIAIKIVSLIVNAFLNVGKKEKKAKEEKKSDRPAGNAAKASVAAPETNSGAVIAAISAAVAMMLGHGNFKIAGIRKKAPAQGRNPWKLAGVQENTRPF